MLKDILDHVKNLKGSEGIIIAFADGSRVKIKAEEYVRIHKVKDKIRTDRHILALLLAGELDDVFPHLDEDDYNRVKDYEANFHKALNLKVGWLDAIAIRTIHQAKMDRKVLATVLLPASNLSKAEYKFVFKAADGHRMHDTVMAHIHNRLGNTAKYNELAAWLGIAADKGEDDEKA